MVLIAVHSLCVCIFIPVYPLLCPGQLNNISQIGYQTQEHFVTYLLQCLDPVQLLLTGAFLGAHHGIPLSLEPGELLL